jgi:hypothetical protein
MLGAIFYSKVGNHGMLSHMQAIACAHYAVICYVVQSLTVFRDRGLHTLTVSIQGPWLAMLNYAAVSAISLKKLYNSMKHCHCLDVDSSQTVQQFPPFSIN